MEPQRFDQLTRGLASRGNRRNLLRGLTGLTASGMALLGLGSRTSLARALQDASSTEEQSVILFEEMGQLAHDHVGSCEEFARKLNEFSTRHQKLIDQYQAEQAAWDRDKREQHVQTYGDRRVVAANRLMAAFIRCSFSVPDGTPAATPAGTTEIPAIRAWQPIATPVTTPGTEQPGAQVDGPACNDTMPMFCSNTDFNSGTFPAAAICTDPDDWTTCTPCLNSDYCTTEYSDNCGTGNCSLTYSSTEYCCHNTCPVSTGDCLTWAGAVSISSQGYGGPNQCILCEYSWCTVTDTCMDNCDNSACCVNDCSS